MTLTTISILYIFKLVSILTLTLKEHVFFRSNQTFPPMTLSCSHFLFHQFTSSTILTVSAHNTPSFIPVCWMLLVILHEPLCAPSTVTAFWFERLHSVMAVIFSTSGTSVSSSVHGLFVQISDSENIVQVLGGSPSQSMTFIP